MCRCLRANPVSCVKAQGAEQLPTGAHLLELRGSGSDLVYLPEQLHLHVALASCWSDSLLASLSSFGYMPVCNIWI